MLMTWVVDRFNREFGLPCRETKKVIAWNIRPDLGVVLEKYKPKRAAGIFVWAPYPPDGQLVPEIASEYPGEAGRHSNTYASPGLERGLPALRLFVTTETELDDSIAFIRAMRDSLPLPEVKPQRIEPLSSVIDQSRMPPVGEPFARREAIPRSVQREVWQRDGGRCVECGSKEKLCFDHIVPFSRGGSNTVRNIQLLCERCNLSKGNRI